MGKLFALVLMTGLVLTSAAQDEERKYIYFGNNAYDDEAYDEAIEYYSDALDVSPLSFKANYNMAGALFRQKEFEKAGELYASIVDLAPTAYDRSKVYHNLGNCYLLNQKIDDAIEAYKDGLKLNPKDEDTRYNLAYALLLKQEQEKQQNQNPENQDNKDPNNDDQNKDPNKDQQNKDDQNKDDQNKDQNKDDQNKDGDKPDQQNNKSNGDQKNEDKQTGQSSQPKISKEQAKRILDAALKREKEIQKNLEKHKQVGTGESSKKDW